MDNVSDFFIQFSIILLLVLANGVFSMSELAVMTSRKVRLQQRAEEGDSGAKTALQLAEEPNRFLSTIQVGITLIGTVSGVFGGASLTDEVIWLLQMVGIPLSLARQLSLVIIVVIITYFQLVLGELVPKRLALTSPESVASAVARPMHFISRIAYPVVGLLSASTEFFLRVLRVKKSEDPPVTEEEINVLMQEGEQVGVFEETETEMVQSIFRLGDRRVYSLMTPRTEIDWIDLNDPFEENLRFILESMHNFFPVAEGSLDNVQGVLRSKDLLARIADGVYDDDPNPDLRPLIQPVLFVPESMLAFDLLENLRATGGKLALVIDEYGGLQGLVTLFDLMEAIVGMLPEAGDNSGPEAVKREDGSWLIDGGMNIVEFKDLLGLRNLPNEDRAGYQTVAGFVLAQLGAIPTVGQGFDMDNFKFEVMDMDGLRVDKILVQKQSEVK